MRIHFDRSVTLIFSRPPPLISSTLRPLVQLSLCPLLQLTLLLLAATVPYRMLCLISSAINMFYSWRSRGIWPRRHQKHQSSAKLDKLFHSFKNLVPYFIYDSSNLFLYVFNQVLEGDHLIEQYQAGRQDLKDIHFISFIHSINDIGARTDGISVQ